jgi:hypothetical protein
MLSVDNVSEKIAFRYTEPFWPYILSGGEPVWQADNVPALGVSRVVMTESLLEFLIQRYVENELIKHACQSN